jgi:hypothetical protein
MGGHKEVGPGHQGRMKHSLMSEDKIVSIVRVGLAETKGFAEGYEAIFGKKKDEDEKGKGKTKKEKKKKKETKKSKK